jgi:hypothetical protein
MTLDVYTDLFDVDLDDVAVDLDARPCRRGARQGCEPEFATGGVSVSCVASASQLCGFSCGLTAGWPT